MSDGGRKGVFLFGGFLFMVPFFSRSVRTGLLLGASLCALGVVAAHAAPPVATPMVTQVDDSTVTALPGDLPRAVTLATDKGALPGDMRLPEIRLELKRPPALQAALDRLVLEQQDRSSPEYHQWLKPADLRAYGPAQADIDKVTAWLGRQGLTVNSVSRSGMEIDFGGSAAAVAKAFHTEIHTVSLRGETHVSNMSAPSIPAALRPVIMGVTLNNFFPKPMIQHERPSLTANTPEGTFYAVTPPDFATIYNEKALFNGDAFGIPITGTGITVALIEQTQIQPKDITFFRASFGLSSYGGTVTQVNPGGCQAPGFTGDEVEAAIDAEWAGAAAPGATLLEAECATVAPFYFGVETALQNLVESGTTATSFSVSYGGNEAEEGYSFEEGWASLVEEAAAEGIAVFVSTGDSGVSTGGFSSDGLFINGLSDTAFNTAVGGTDFLDTALGENSTYWSSENSNTGQSALSYIPETPWNNSCASTVIAELENTTPAKLCGSDPEFGQAGVGGSGGQSVYFAKPSWQLTGIPGMPNDNRRDQPDVSLFAANGEFGHFYLICMSDRSEGGAPCDYHNSTDLLSQAYGGTSFAAPDFAGIAALIQELDVDEGFAPQTGNLAPTLYKLAAAQYATEVGVHDCNSSLGNKVGAGCTFYNVTYGNNAEPCINGTVDCVGGQSGAGILHNKSVTPDEAYPSQEGYSLAVGLGTVNVQNLVAGSVP